MKKAIFALLLTALYGWGADNTEDVDSNDIKYQPLTLYAGDAGTIQVPFFNDGEARAVDATETAYFWWSTNALDSASIYTLTAEGSNTFSYGSSFFPTNSPTISKWMWGAGIGNKGYGHGDLFVLKNPWYTASNLGITSNILDFARFDGYLNVGDFPMIGSDTILVTNNGTHIYLDFAPSSDTTTKAYVDAGDLANSNYTATAVSAEAVLRIAGDLGISNYVDSVLGTETALRIAGDLAGTNYTDSSIATLTGNIPSLEEDIKALKIYHYGTDDITITPDSEFTFDGAGAITAYSGTNANIVIPWAIGGVAVTNIGPSVFQLNGTLVTLDAPKSVVSVQGAALSGCSALESVSIPSAVTIGPSTFASCSSLATLSLLSVDEVGNTAMASCSALVSVYFGGDKPTEGTTIYQLTPNVTNYVTSVTATGWGDTFGGRPVVFPQVTANNAIVKGTLEVDGVTTLNSNLVVSGTASGATPTADAHFATKLYTDTADAFLLPYTGATTNVDLGTNGISADTFYVDSDTHRVGIGTNGPSGILDVKANAFTLGELSPDTFSHQGYTTDGIYHYPIGTEVIWKRNYDAVWSIISSNNVPFDGISGDHLGDGCYYNGKLYIPGETYVSPTTFSDQQILVFNADTLARENAIDVSAQGYEISGLVVVPEDGDNGIIYTSSYADGSKLWKYDLDTFSYLGYIDIATPFTQIQGITYKDGFFYLSAYSHGIYVMNKDGTGIKKIAYFPLSGSINEGLDYSQDTLRWLVDNGVGSGDGQKQVRYYSVTPTDGLVVLPTGNVGIGVPLPTTRLDVNGDATIRGNGTFTGTVSGITPTADAHFATKLYTDTADALLVPYTGADKVVTIDSANVRTNTFGGLLTILGSRVQEGFSTTASGAVSYAGGGFTTASGSFSHAEGHSANAIHDNTFVWSSGAETSSTAIRQYTVYASGGIRLLGGPLEVDGVTTLNSNLVVSGTATASNLSGSNTGDQDLTASNVAQTNATLGATTQDALNYLANNSGGAPEGTAVLSTGPELITKFLRADGDGTCSWQVPAGGGGSGTITCRWDYVYAESAGLCVGPAQPSSYITNLVYGVVTQEVAFLAFDDATEEYTSAQTWQTWPSWDGKVIVRGSAWYADATPGSVTWTLHYVGDGTTASTADLTYTGAASSPTSLDNWQATATLTGVDAGDAITYWISRDPTDDPTGDNYIKTIAIGWGQE